MSSFNRQEVFNAAVAGLAAQGFNLSMAPYPQDDAPDNHRCMYRAPQNDGTMYRCAIGVLIKDEYYRPSFEGTVLSGNPDTFDALMLSLDIPNEEWNRVRVEDSMFLFDLQNAHDSVMRIAGHSISAGFASETVKKNLREVAITYNLDLPVELGALSEESV